MSSTTTQILCACEEVINELCVSCIARALKLQRAARAHLEDNALEAGGSSGSCTPTRGRTGSGRCWARLSLRAAEPAWEQLLSLPRVTLFSVPHGVFPLQIDVFFLSYFFSHPVLHNTLLFLSIFCRLPGSLCANIALLC